MKPRLAKSTPPAATVPTDAGQAFNEVAAEIAAVRDEDLLPINIDIARAASIALAAASHLKPLQAAFKTLPDYDASTPARLRTYALAALYAHLVAIERENDRFTPLLEEATKLRELLLGSAELIALFGFVSTERVAEIRAGSGHLDTASDLIALRALFGDDWERLAGKTPVTREQVDRAGVVGTALHELVASRKFVAPPEDGPNDPHRTRARAFTLLVRKYDECRRGVTFLRWMHGDADVFMPSIYLKGRRKTPAVIGDGDASEADTPSAPAPSEVPVPPRLIGMAPVV